MTISARDRRALSFMGVSLILGVIIRFWPDSSSTTTAALPAGTTEQSEQRLARLRDIAAQIPAKEAVLKSINADLAAREKGLIRADTVAQAQAQVLQLLRRLAQGEMIEIRATELAPPAPFGGAYQSIAVSLQLECRMEQLVNFISAIGQQPELLSTSDLRITSGNPREKTVGVRITVMGLVPMKAPATKGGSL